MYTVWNDKEQTLTKVEEPDPSLRYTYADYLKWNFEEQLELIRGRIYKMSPAPTPLHQQVSGRLFGEMYPLFKNQRCQLFAAPFDVRLPVQNQKKPSQIDTVVQPDLCVVCDKSKIDKRGCIGPPDLLVEILSKRTGKKDKTTKLRLYQESGVKEYWIVSPKAQTVAVFVLNESGLYDDAKQYAGKDVVKSEAIPGLAINLSDIFL